MADTPISRQLVLLNYQSIAMSPRPPSHFFQYYWLSPEDLEWVFLWSPQYGKELVHASWFDEEGNPRHSQPLNFHPLKLEGVGAVTVPLSREGHIGLQKRARPVIQWEYLPHYKEVIEHAERTGEPPFIPKDWTGQPSVEAPRGFHEYRDGSPEDTARRETEEETALFVSSTQYLGRVIANTSFEVQPTDVYLVEFDFTQHPGQLPDETEAFLTDLTFYSFPELMELKRNGELFCGFTLAAIQNAVFQHPSWFIRFLGGYTKDDLA
jgi:8-oxo-dGTP pyrophosphatase MutT (NUDIX family)